MNNSTTLTGSKMKMTAAQKRAARIAKETTAWQAEMGMSESEKAYWSAVEADEIEKAK